MKIILVLMSVLLLAACGPEQKLADTPPPAPVVVPEPTIAEKPKPAEPAFQMSNIMGLQKDSVEKILGEPSLKRVEKAAEVWLYDNQFCNAHIYFYENDNSDMHVEYVETSEEKNLMGLEGQRADFCISTFLQD
ncbi:MAG: hypothetical protein JKY84_10945 [Emcibacteraceae bacterium]|nr:hypothetical protein [Emcibacteraceae bacterium]